MQMQLMEHLDELRTRLTRSVSVIMIAFVLLMFKAQALINFLKIPLVNALPPGTPALHFTGPMDVMFVGMKVAFMAAVIVTSPFWLREFWKFFEPGLYAVSFGNCLLLFRSLAVYAWIPDHDWNRSRRADHNSHGLRRPFDSAFHWFRTGFRNTFDSGVVVTPGRH